MVQIWAGFTTYAKEICTLHSEEVLEIVCLGNGDGDASERLRYEWMKLKCNFHGSYINLLKPTGHVMHQQFNIQQLYVLPPLYLCVLYLSENKQRLVPLTS